MADLFFIISLIFLNLYLAFKFENYSKIFPIFDHPDEKRKFHKKSVRVIGGIIIMLNLSLYALYYNFLLSDKNLFLNIFSSRYEFLIFFISAFSIFIVGVVDDKLNLPAINKLFFISLIILICVFCNKNIINDINFSFLDDRIYLNKFSFFFTIFAYIIFMNAFNMLDGVNLQVGVYSCFVVLFFFFRGLDFLFFLTILIALLTYLKLNFQNKIFLGDSGSLLISFVFSYLFIKFYNLSYIKFSDDILLILLLPGLEIIRLIIERAFKNENILKADRNHIHHILGRICNSFQLFLIIQFLFIFPYLISWLIGNNLAIIIFYSVIYFIIIFYVKFKFRKKIN